MEKLEEFIDDKRALSNLYNDFFRAHSIQFISEPSNARSNYWLNSILLTDKKERDEFLIFRGFRHK